MITNNFLMAEKSLELLISFKTMMIMSVRRLIINHEMSHIPMVDIKNVKFHLVRDELTCTN